MKLVPAARVSEYGEFDCAASRTATTGSSGSRIGHPRSWSEARAFYYRRRVIVVGAGGFIGSHLCRRLAELRADVVGIVRSPADFARLPRTITTVCADACSSEQLRAVIRGDDTIFQLAGRSGAAASVAEPVADMRANCGSMLALLDVAASREPRPRIVFIGSRLQYGRVTTLPVDESHPKQPTSPYGLHKGLCEEYLAYYHRQFGISYAVARLTNPYGSTTANPQQSYNVFDQLIARAAAGLTVSVYGDGRQIRDYIHVSDVVEALLLLGRLSATTVVNVGSGVGVAFADAVREVVAKTRGSMIFTAWPPQALAVETGDFVANIDKARELGFTPTISLREGIQRALIRCENVTSRTFAAKKITAMRVARTLDAPPPRE